MSTIKNSKDMDKDTKLYKLGGSKGHWWLQWSDGGAWKTTSFQYVSDLKRTEKILKGQGYKRQTEPEEKTEEARVRLVITADKECLADYLRDLAEYLDTEDVNLSPFEKYKGRVEMKRID